MNASSSAFALARRDALRDELPAAVELLRQRRAGDINDSDIDDYVALQWLEWHGGTLRLTATGQNLCKRVAPQPLAGPGSC
jgi:hypothetical protein